MSIREFFSRPFSAIAECCKSHEEFIAVRFTRILALVFLIVSFVFLVKSLGLI